MYDVDAFDTPAKVVGSLHHKGRVVMCYLDAGTWEGRPFVVMPLLGGGTLRARLARRRTLPLDSHLCRGMKREKPKSVA